jgi:ABC-2 type transport system permease protein
MRRGRSGIRAERIRMIARKEIAEIFRDRRARGLLFMMPLIQLMIFGYAVSTDIRNTSTFLVDHDRSRLSRDLVSALTSSGYFRICGRSERSRDIVDALDHGKAVLGMEVPAGFETSIRSGRGARVQLLFDGTNSNIATVSRGYAERIVQNFSANLAGARPPIDLRERAWFNPELRSQNYNVPAIVAMIIMLICSMLTAMAIVREREVGTLEQLMVSPLKPIELIIGKMLPFAAIGIVDLILVTVIALLWFRVPFEGSFPLLLLASVFYIMSALGIGLLLSTVSKTMQEAFMGNFLIFMPMILLSGFMFPVSSMPPFFRWITLLNPVRHYLVIVRGIFLKGTGPLVLWPELLALFLMGTLIQIFAAGRFHKTAG